MLNDAKRLSGGPQQVLRYLGRYTHRVAIANSRLVACENGRVHFRWKDYRAENNSNVTLALPPKDGLRRWTYHTLFGLIAVIHVEVADLPVIVHLIRD
jgi:hypothetical protein